MLKKSVMHVYVLVAVGVVVAKAPDFHVVVVQ